MDALAKPAGKKKKSPKPNKYLRFCNTEAYA